MGRDLSARRLRKGALLSIAVIALVACAVVFARPFVADAANAAVTLKVQSASSGQSAQVKEFTRDRLAYLSSYNGDGSEGGYQFNEKVMAVAQYVLLEQLLDDAGVSFEAGDKIVVSGGGSVAASYTLSYDDVHEPHYFFPDYEGNRVYNAENAVEVPGPGIALAWNSADINAFDGVPTAGYAFGNAYYTAYDSGNIRFFIGLTEDQFASGNLKGSRLIQWVDSVTVVKENYTPPASDPADPSNPGPDVPGPDVPIDPSKPADPSNPNDPARPSDPDPIPLSNFTDVGLGAGEVPHWVVSGGWLRSALSAGIVQGYVGADGLPNGLFGPDDKVLRGQLAVMLYRHAHPDWKTASGDASMWENETDFSDNAGGMYYTRAINWAYEQGILKGSANDAGDVLVRPEDTVTREESAVMLYRYAASCGADATSGGYAAFSSAPDATAVSTWALEAVGWCYSHGVMNGLASTGELAPQSNATRAEMCKMTMATIASI